jgi:predicted ABC-type ATPase
VSPVDSVADMPRVPRELLADDERSQAGDRDSVDQRDGASPRDTARPADSLRQRMDHLPAGHPSSPYEADGRLRQSTPRLRDLDPAEEYEDPARVESGPTDTGDSPEMIDAGDDVAKPVGQAADPRTDRQPDDRRLSRVDPPPSSESPREAPAPADQRRLVTDAEWTEHKSDVRDLLESTDTEKRAPDRHYTTDPDKEQWAADRNRVQAALVADMYEEARDVPCSGLAIIAGGLGGAGKSTVLSKYAGIDMSQYLTVNPDNIKVKMAERGLVPEIEGLSPMEASVLVHEEASFIAKRLALRAMADRKNLIWDITMSRRDTTEGRIQNLRAAGYAVDGIFVDIPIETSIRRADARHREGHDDYCAGIGLGGRYVAPEITEAQADPDWGSKNRKTFEEIRHLLDHWSRFDNSVDGRPALLVETSQPDDKDPEE